MLWRRAPTSARGPAILTRALLTSSKPLFSHQQNNNEYLFLGALCRLRKMPHEVTQHSSWHIAGAQQISVSFPFSPLSPHWPQTDTVDVSSLFVE